MRFVTCTVVAAAVSVAAHGRTTNVTWTRDLEPIVQARCVGCHRPDGRGPMPLTTYEEARPWAKAIKEEVLTRRMPKWHAVRGYGDFLNDPSLSPFEIALFVAWADGGAPKNPRPGAPAAPPVRATPIETPSARADARERTVACDRLPTVSGRLLAVRFQLERGRSVGLSTSDGQIVAWVRDFDPDFAETYWLRKPVGLITSRRLQAQADGPCAITLWIDDASAQSPQMPPY